LIKRFHSCHVFFCIKTFSAVQIYLTLNLTYIKHLTLAITFCVTCCKRRLSVCLSVLSVTLSCHTSLFCNNPSSTYTIEMNLHIWIDLCERYVSCTVSITLASIFWELFPFVKFSLFCNKSSSTYTIEMKLHIWIDIGERKCHVQDPYFRSYIPLSIF